MDTKKIYLASLQVYLDAFFKAGKYREYDSLLIDVYSEIRRLGAYTSTVCYI